MFREQPINYSVFLIKLFHRHIIIELSKKIKNYPGIVFADHMFTIQKMTKVYLTGTS